MINKSDYLKFFKCPKWLWLEKNKSELKPVKENQTFIDVTGKLRELFLTHYKYTNCTIFNENKKIDKQKTHENTIKLLQNSDLLFNPTFKIEDTFINCDAMKKVKKGYNIYFIKNTIRIKQHYLEEISYTISLLKSLNIPIYRTYLVILDTKYEFKNKLDVDKLFKFVSITRKLKPFEDIVSQKFEEYKNYNFDNMENIEYNQFCHKPYDCPFIDYCRKPLPSPSVFDIYAFNKKYDFYKKNILSFEDVLNSEIELNEFQKRQIEFHLNDSPMFIDKEKIKEFLKKFTYPLYFLDFETTQQEIPEYKNISPYMQLPFQYSLHYIKEENGELHHTEFLADINENPMENLAKSLYNEIPENACIVAYNKSFEQKIIALLAQKYPKYQEKFLKLTQNFIDLIEPFNNGWIYDKQMAGSFSLKSIFPALCPEETINYNSLENIHNGFEARYIFPQLKFMDKEQREKERENLLKYCFVDTYSLVKIWQKLIKLCED